MQILLLGAGRMAYGLIYDLLKNKAVSSISVVDKEKGALLRLREFFNDSSLETFCFDVDATVTLKPHLSSAAAVVSALPYQYNFDMAELAVECGRHFFDLGGDDRILERQIRLHETARDKKIALVPNCGLAPGLVSIIAAYAMDQLARVDDVAIRVGNLPLSAQTPLKYKNNASIHGLLNACGEPVQTLEDGQIKKTPAFGSLENIEFQSPFGLLEAFYTSGATSTLLNSFKHDVINIDFKSIRYPGHGHLMRAMIDQGFANSNSEFRYSTGKLNMRSTFEAMLEHSLDYASDDVVLIRITAKGQKEGREKTIEYQAIEYGDKKTTLTAIQRCCAFPASIIVQMILDNKITQRGLLKLETAVPGFDFINEIERRGIFFEKND